MPVSVRTRLPVCSAWRNSAERTGPHVPSSWARSKARRTWPTTSVSPVTTDSRPEVTENRWEVTSSSKRTMAWADSSSTETVRVLGQDVVDLRHGVVEPVHHRVDLGAQAGREHDRLLDVAAVVQRAERLVQVGVGDRRRLEQRQRGLRVLEPYDDDGHSVPSWVGTQLCRSRPSVPVAGADRRGRQASSGPCDSPTDRIMGGALAVAPGLLLAGPVEPQDLQLDGEVHVAEVHRAAGR